ncbi:MAG: ribonuclease R, partial [Alistipes sp.]|nr:ribonuclease R [Alistipes sp.]
MKKKRNRRESFSDRASFIVGMFREQPERKFTLKALAAASGGADKQGRDMTRSILDTLLEQGYIESEGRGGYKLSRSKLTRYQGVADMSNSGNLYVTCEEL